MAKLAVAEVTYRFYLRVKDDKASPTDLKAILSSELSNMIETESPISEHISEWQGEVIAPEFLDGIAWGENDDELTVRIVAEQHRNFGFNPTKPNQSPDQLETPI